MTELPEKLEVLKDFDTWRNYAEFSFSNDDIESIVTILITIGNQNHHFTIFKHIYAVTILRQDRVLGFMPINDRFEKLNSNILQINNSIDFIYVEKELIINNLKTLTNSYGYKEVIKAEARQRVDLIERLGIIENIDELILFVDDVKYAKRILKVNPESPVLNLAKTRIIAFIKNHEKLSKKIRLSDDGNQIKLDTKISKIITIGILNDDYLKSNLTDLDYESERKSEFNIDE